MIKVNINLVENGYPIYITTDYSGLVKSIAGTRISGRMVLVTDSNVDSRQAPACMEALAEAGFEVSKYVIPAGEANKNLDTVKDIYRYLIDKKLDRSSALIALGGGVTGDITGFAASTFMRGIGFIQVPTTLLAQADSSVGGKVGVDFEGRKNIVGAFYQPKMVYINVNSLKTLPKNEMRNGLAEIVKHGLISDAEFFDYVDYNIRKIFECDAEIMQYIAKMNCTIKGSVVEQDEKESDLRATLNFGHTIGHAVESASGFRYSHGECVAVGIMGAFKMAQYLEMVGEETTRKVSAVLTKIGLPVRFDGLDKDEVYRYMLHDKKAKSGRLQFILPKAIGEVLQLSIDDHDLVRKVISELV